MTNNPNIIIELGDRFMATPDGKAGHVLRAVVRVTDKPLSPPPSDKNKSVTYFGPVGDLAFADGADPGQWTAQDAVRLLRLIASEMERVYVSSDKSVQGDLLTVMAHELRGAKQ